MARFKEGDKVRVVTRPSSIEDSAATHYYDHMGGLTGTVENYYNDQEIAVKVDLDLLPDVAKRVHKDATKRMRAKFEDSISNEQKGQLSNEELKFTPHYMLLVRGTRPRKGLAAATLEKTPMDAADNPIVFFDGHCGLCNRTVDWILRNDTEHRFHFAPLQGETAGELFKGMPEEELYQSFWLHDDKGLHKKSTAIFRVCRQLNGMARVLSLGMAIPRPIRDWGYGVIARNRYKIWGRTDTCRIPSPEERAYFLP